MDFFYFDESIQRSAGFIVGAFVYAKDKPDSEVYAALSRSGLRPRVEEFKSGAYMASNPAQVRAREELYGILSGTRLGLVVAPANRRQDMGKEALLGLKKILSTNEFTNPQHQASFDRGLFHNRAAALRIATEVGVPPKCVLHFEQDSKVVAGLQLADLVAHTCGIMLAETMGFLHKNVTIVEEGYPETEINLGVKLWAMLRHKFFAAGPPPPDTWKSQLDFQVDVASRGLHVAASCSDALRNAALDRFGRMYVGCIH